MEGFCRYEGDLLEHLEFIKSPEQCQEACAYLEICHYFVYDYSKDDCELLGSPLRKCDILRGPPEPSYETCITITSTSTQPATQTTTPTYTSSMPTKKSTKTTTSFKTTQISTTQKPNILAVMLIGGYGKNGLLSDVEIIDPFNSESNCMKPMDFPDARYGLIAELFNEKPIICSGYGAGGDRKDCYVYDFEEWVPSLTNLTIARRYATSIVLNDDTMWVSGGDRTTSKSSSETLHKGEVFGPSTDLPEPMEQHCSSKINDTHFFVAGNKYGTQTAAYLVNVDENNADLYHFTKLPNMRHQRYGAACMTMMGSDLGDDKLLVAGGYRFDSFTTTEIYSLKTSHWDDGPQLPRGFYMGSYVQYPISNDFMLIGGKDDSGTIFDNIMRYNQENGEFELMPVNLESGRWSFGATLVYIKDEC